MATTTTMATVAFATVLLLAIAVRSELTVDQIVPPACRSTLMSLAPCLNYLSGKDTSPPQPCCAHLDTAIKTQPGCLCALLAGDTAEFGLSFNTTRALSLPETCNVPAPPVSTCNAPAHAPAGWGAEAPNTSGGGSGSSSDGVLYEPNLVVFAFFLLAAVSSSFAL